MMTDAKVSETSFFAKAIVLEAMISETTIPPESLMSLPEMKVINSLTELNFTTKPTDKTEMNFTTKPNATTEPNAKKVILKKLLMK